MKDTFIKDSTTGIVHNMDDAGLKHVMQLRERTKKEMQLQRDLEDVRAELSDIKNLLQDFLRNKNG